MSLTQKILKAKKNDHVPHEIRNEVLNKIYHFLITVKRYDPDHTGDFLLVIHPKIDSMIFRFRYQGIPFENYLFTTVNLRFRTYIKSLQKKPNDYMLSQAAEQACYTSPEPPPQDQVQPEYLKDLPTIWKLSPSGRVKNQVQRTRLKILLAKNAFHIGDQDIRKFAPLLGEEEDQLFTILQEVRRATEARTNRIYPMIHKRNEFLVKLKILEHQLNSSYGPETKALKKKITLVTRAVTRLTKRILATPIAPSHKFLSAHLNIPKGTVDSALFYLRKEVKRALSKS